MTKLFLALSTMALLVAHANAAMKIMLDGEIDISGGTIDGFDAAIGDPFTLTIIVDDSSSETGTYPILSVQFSIFYLGDGTNVTRTYQSSGTWSSVIQADSFPGESEFSRIFLEGPIASSTNEIFGIPDFGFVQIRGLQGFSGQAHDISTWSGENITGDFFFFGQRSEVGNHLSGLSPRFEPISFVPGSGGDPHFKLWNGHTYDFHGVCDLVLLQNPGYASGDGMDIHIRTKARYEYSFIESAALRIGEDVLEVGSYGEYFFNGVENAIGAQVTMGQSAIVSYVQDTRKKHQFDVVLDDGTKITLRSFKDMVYVSINAKSWNSFKDSVGMMGSPSFSANPMVARDGKTVLDANAFGKEWQVRDTEGKLFQNVDRFPQYPHSCVMPEVKSGKASRRLGVLRGVTKEAAQMACSKFHTEQDINACVYDVMATGDLEIAEAGAF